jgi:hypothetical protein
MEAFLANIAAFVTALETHAFPQGYIPHAVFGPTSESDVSPHHSYSHPRSHHASDANTDTTSPLKGNAIILLLGWESKDMHLRFRESSLFKENIHLLRGGAAEVEMVIMFLAPSSPYIYIYIYADNYLVIVSCSSD